MLPLEPDRKVELDFLLDALEGGQSPARQNHHSRHELLDFFEGLLGGHRGDFDFAFAGVVVLCERVHPANEHFVIFAVEGGRLVDFPDSIEHLVNRLQVFEIDVFRVFFEVELQRRILFVDKFLDQIDFRLLFGLDFDFGNIDDGVVFLVGAKLDHRVQN